MLPHLLHLCVPVKPTATRYKCVLKRSRKRVCGMGGDVYGGSIFSYWKCPPARPTFSLLYPSWPVLRIRLIVHTQNNGSNFPQFLISDPWNNGQFRYTTKQTHGNITLFWCYITLFLHIFTELQFHFHSFIIIYHTCSLLNPAVCRKRVMK